MTDQEIEDTKQRLITVAGEVFAEQGYRAATVREICNRARANVAAVNYYFGDKEQLYIQAVQAAHCCPTELMQPNWPAGMRAEEKLRFFVEHLLTHLLNDQRPAWHAQLMLREMADPTEACVQLVEAYIRPTSATLMGILKELLPESAPIGERWLIGASIIAQCLFYKTQRPIFERLIGSEQFARLDVQTLTEHITRFSLAAVTAPKAGLQERLGPRNVTK